MFVVSHSGWMKLFMVVALFYIIQIVELEARFVPKKSCNFPASDVLEVNSKMWIKSGDNKTEAETEDGEKCSLPQHSVFKVNINRGNYLVIEALPPYRSKCRFLNATQLRIDVGEVTVSCIKDKERAVKELGFVETASKPPSSSSSSSSSSSPTVIPPNTDPTPPNTETIPPLVEKTTTTVSSVASSPVLRPGAGRSFDFGTLNNNFTTDMKAADTMHVGTTTESVNVQKQTTPETKVSSELITSETAEVKTTATTTTTTSKPTTLMHPILTTNSGGLETKDNDETSPKLVLATQTTTPKTIGTQTTTVKATTPGNKLPPTTDVASSRAVTMEVITPSSSSSSLSETTGPQSTPLKTPNGDTQPNIAEPSDPKPNSLSQKLKNYILYIATGAFVIFFLLLVTFTICVLQRKRSRRLDNHEDLFITSTHDDASYSRSNDNVRYMMYSEAEPEVVVSSQELEERILGGAVKDDTMVSEKPKCLAVD